MPELPEVQTIVNDLIAAELIGRRIAQARVYWPRTIATSPADRFCSQIRNLAIERIQRRAKFILIALDKGQTLIVHLRMTGRFQWGDERSVQEKHVHVALTMDDGRVLCFHDTRKFGRFYLMKEPRTLLGKLGPEPLSAEFTAAAFKQQLMGRQRQIKPLLLDQTFLAGLGNIYVDEALWDARIHPLRGADSLHSDEVAALHAAIRHVLRQGIKHAGTTLGNGPSNFYSLGKVRGGNANHLKVFRRTGAPCPRCRTVITRIIVAQRSTHVCEKCQRLSALKIKG
ncbi:MAG: DNA-formamidopyrimidine glycosylase [Desulfatitalea sp.]|nr:DNA-formamidopyrimidine glycosylase [Desulfatitalea sp.]